MPITDPRRRAEAMAMGIDPDRYSMAEDAPAAPPAIAAQPEGTSSAAGAFGRSGVRGLIPSFGAGAGGAAGLWAAGLLGAPETGGLSLLLPLAGIAGGIGGSLLAQKGQDIAAEHLLSPETKAAMDQQAALDQAQHPLAATLGGVASAAPFFELDPGSSIKGLAAAYKLARGVVPEAERAAALAAAKRVGANVGLGAATGVINPLVEGRAPTLEDVGMGAGQALLFGQHRDYLGKVPGLGFMRHPVNGAVKGEAEAPPDQSAITDETRLLPQLTPSTKAELFAMPGPRGPMERNLLPAPGQETGVPLVASLGPDTGGLIPMESGISRPGEAAPFKPTPFPAPEAGELQATIADQMKGSGEIVGKPTESLSPTAEAAVKATPQPIVATNPDGTIPIPKRSSASAETAAAINAQKGPNATHPIVEQTSVPPKLEGTAPRANLPANKEEVRQGQSQTPSSGNSVLSGEKVAPVTYAGFQEGIGKRPGVHLYNLTETISPKLTKGSTVTERDITEGGFKLPESEKAKETTAAEPPKPAAAETAAVNETLGPDTEPKDFVRLMAKRDDLIGSLQVPEGYRVKDIQTSRWHSVYWIVEGPEGDQFKIRIADHQAGKTAHGPNDFTAEVPKTYTLDQFSKSMRSAEEWLRKQAGTEETPPPEPVAKQATEPVVNLVGKQRGKLTDADILEEHGDFFREHPVGSDVSFRWDEGGKAQGVVTGHSRQGSLQLRVKGKSDPVFVLESDLIKEKSTEPAKAEKAGKGSVKDSLTVDKERLTAELYAADEFTSKSAAVADKANVEWATHVENVVRPIQARIRQIQGEVGQLASDAKRTTPEVKGKQHLTKKAFLEQYGVASMDEANALYKSKNAEWSDLEKQLEEAEQKRKDLEIAREKRRKEWSSAAVRSGELRRQLYPKVKEGDVGAPQASPAPVNPNERHQPALPDLSPEELLSHPANADILAYYEKLATKHNITLSRSDEKLGKQLVNGEQVANAGLANINERAAKYDGTLASVDTAPHEILHIFIDDLRTSPKPAEKALYDDLIGIFKGNEERAIQIMGVRNKDLVKARLEGRQLARFRMWLQDFWSWMKSKWGKATPADMANLMARRLVDGEAVARGEKPPLSPTENIHYQSAASREDHATEEQRRTTLEQDIHANDFSIPGLRGMQQAIRAKGPLGARLADAMEGLQDRYNHWMGKYRNQAIVESLRVSKADQLAVLKYRDFVQEHPNGTPPTLTPQQDALNTKLSAMFENSAKDAIAAGKQVFDEGDWRDMLLRKNYNPHSMSADVYNTIHEKQGSADYNRYKKLYIDWVMAGGTKGEGQGVDLPVAEQMWKERTDNPLQSIPRATSRLKALEMRAGMGLPPEMREMDLMKRMTNYFDKYAHAMSWYEKVEAHTPENAIVRSLINATDQFGKQDLNAHQLEDGTPTTNIIDRNVDHAFQAILRNYTPGQRTTEAWDRLIKSLMLQTVTGAGDFLGGIGNSAVHFKLADYANIGKASRNLGEGIKAGIRQNVISPIYSAQSSTMAGGGVQIEALSNTADHLNKAASLIYKITGRGQLEQYGRGLLMSLGMIKTNAAMSRITARTHDANDVKWMNNFAGKGWEEMLRSGNFTADAIEKTAAKFVQDIQGDYSGRFVPHWAVSGQLAPFFSLAKWNIEMANRFTRNVVNPLVKQGDPGPFLKMTLGSLAAGEIIHAVRQLITSKKSQDANWDEIAAAGGEGLAYRMMADAAFAGYSGLYADVIKQAFDLGKGNQAQGFRFPLIGAVTTTADRFRQLAVALDQGENPLEMVGVFANTFAKDNVQMYRALMHWVSEDEAKATQRANAYRDLKVFRDQAGYPTPGTDAGLANPFLNPLKQKYQHSEDPTEIASIAPRLVQQAMDRAGNDPEQLKTLLTNYRAPSRDMLPSMTTHMDQLSKYLQWLGQTQGPESQQAAIADYQKKQMLDSVKSGLIPRL